MSVLLLPIYFEKGVISIYQIIGMRFNLSMQKISSLVFLATRLLADGVRFLATAVIVQILTGWSIFTSIFIIGCTTLIYSFFGGIRSILWIDFFQFILYLFGGLTAVRPPKRYNCLLYTSPSPRDKRQSRMPSSA